MEGGTLGGVRGVVRGAGVRDPVGDAGNAGAQAKGQHVDPIGIDAHGAFNTITNTGTITARDAIRITDDAPTTLSSNEIFNSGTLIGRLNAISVSGGQIRVNNTGLAATTTPSTAAPEAAITLNGTNDDVTINGLDGAAPEVVLDEDDLATLGDDQGSDQTDPLTVGGGVSIE